MKIVSLVPSWTETIINAGINVVARTRFCIHPSNTVKSLQVVGGTKSVDWSKLKETPDLVIMDKEENTLEMAKHCPYPMYATHIKSIFDVPDELFILADLIGSNKLYEKAYDWQQLLFSNKSVSLSHLEKLEVLKWWRFPNNHQKNIVYLIWKDPFMSVGKQTFIYSMFKFLGIDLYNFNYSDYPEVDLSQLDKKDSLLLFSSEPFPFHKQKLKMMNLGFSCAWIDGEVFSWYGDRSFDFLNRL